MAAGSGAWYCLPGGNGTFSEVTACRMQGGVSCWYRAEAAEERQWGEAAWGKRVKRGIARWGVGAQESVLMSAKVLLYTSEEARFSL
jgi:hypothetical protein